MAGRIVIVGAGIAGLAAAHGLRKERGGSGITLIEGRDRLGGVIVTEREGPFLLDGGPDSFLGLKRGGIELCRELGLEDDLVPAAEIPARVRILVNGRLEVMPDSFILGVPLDLKTFLRTSLLTAGGKVRMAMEPFLPARSEGEESVAGFWRRRMGREAYERIAEPLIGAIHAGDTERLSLPANFPELAAMESNHGSLTKALRSRRGRRGEQRDRRLMGFVSLRGGMGDLVGALERSIEGVEIRLGDAVQAVAGAGAPYRIHLAGGEVLEADVVLFASPAHVTAAIVEGDRPALAEALRAVPYVTTAVIFLAYRRSAFAEPPPGYGFLIPRTEGRKLIACTVVSNKFPGRAPDDRVLLRTFVGGALQEEVAFLPEDEIVALAAREVAEILPVREPPVWSRLYRWEKAIPQYNLGHRGRVDAIEEELLRSPGLHVTGSAYHGSGIPDCIRYAREAVERILG